MGLHAVNTKSCWQRCLFTFGYIQLTVGSDSVRRGHQALTRLFRIQWLVLGHHLTTRYWTVMREQQLIHGTSRTRKLIIAAKNSNMNTLLHSLSTSRHFLHLLSKVLHADHGPGVDNHRMTSNIRYWWHTTQCWLKILKALHVVNKLLTTGNDGDSPS